MNFVDEIMQISKKCQNSKILTTTILADTEKTVLLKIRLKKYFVYMLTGLVHLWTICNWFQSMSNPDSISTIS